MMNRKTRKKFDRRQAGYQASLARLSETQRKGYRMPGSRNSKKAGG